MLYSWRISHYSMPIHTTQVNSTFHARWLASSEVISQVLISPPSSRRKTKCHGFCRHIVTNKVTLWATSYSSCVVYTKTIIHLSVGESGVYLPPLRWIIVNNNDNNDNDNNNYYFFHFKSDVFSTVVLACFRLSGTVDDWNAAGRRVGSGRERRGDGSWIPDPARSWSRLSPTLFCDRPHWPRVWNRLLLC